VNEAVPASPFAPSIATSASLPDEEPDEPDDEDPDEPPDEVLPEEPDDELELDAPVSLASLPPQAHAAASSAAAIEEARMAFSAEPRAPALRDRRRDASRLR
jgi:hypothetical protein